MVWLIFDAWEYQLVVNMGSSSFCIKRGMPICLIYNVADATVLGSKILDVLKNIQNNIKKR